MGGDNHARVVKKGYVNRLRKRDLDLSCLEVEVPVQKRRRKRVRYVCRHHQSEVYAEELQTNGIPAGVVDERKVTREEAVFRNSAETHERLDAVEVVIAEGNADGAL